MTIGITIEGLEKKLNTIHGYSLTYYKFFLNRSMRPRPILDIFKRSRLTSTATSLHRDMYTAFAEGNLKELSTICADGIFSSFRSRLAQRKPNERVEWNCQMLRRPKLVSHRASQMPFPAPDGTKIGMRQAIFRMQTRQNLVKSIVKTGGPSQNFARPFRGPNKFGSKEQDERAEGRREREEREMKRETVIVSESEPKDVTEYLVLQRRIYNSEEQDWMVWGFAEETTLAQYLKMREDTKKMQNAPKPKGMPAV